MPSKIAWPLIALLFSFGCKMQPAQMYEGEPRPMSEIASLSSDGPTKIYEIDGKPHYKSTFHLLPGSHRVHFRQTLHGTEILGNYAGQTAKRNCVAFFEFEAGHAYRIERGNVRTGKTTSGFRGSSTGFDVPLAIIDMTEEVELDDGLESCEGDF